MKLASTLLVLAISSTAAAQAPGDLLWSTQLDGTMRASPVVGPDGSIYVATFQDGGRLYRLEGATGTILVSRDLPGTVEVSVALGDNGLIYLNTLRTPMANGQQADAVAAAYRADTLEEVWVSDTLYSGADTSPILGRNNRVYLGVVAHPDDPGHPAGRYYSFDGLTGEARIDMWLEGWAACPGVIDEQGRVFFGVEDKQNGAHSGNTWPGVFYALTGEDAPDASGNGPLAWPPFYAPEGDFGSPVGYAEGVVYSTCRDGNLYGFDAETGYIEFTFDLDAPSWTGVTIGRHPVSGNLILYTGTQGVGNGGFGERTFYAIELDGSLNGSLLWSYTGSDYYGFGNGALDDAGVIYVVSGLGRLLALDALTGAFLWMRALPGGGGGTAGPTVDNNGAVIVTSSAGIIRAFKAEGNHLADDAPWPVYKHDLRGTANVLSPIRDTVDVAKPYCTATTNSSGEYGRMGFIGSASLGRDDAILVAGGCPANQFGIFYYGAAATEVPFGNGNRCVGGPVFRLPVSQVGATGEVLHALDYAAPPSAGGQITAGTTWYFQFWFRDQLGGGVGYDLTDGLEVTFGS
jgi:outer membrane protein assembly factor BamB